MLCNGALVFVQHGLGLCLVFVQCGPSLCATRPLREGSVLPTGRTARVVIQDFAPPNVPPAADPDQSPTHRPCQRRQEGIAAGGDSDASGSSPSGQGCYPPLAGARLLSSQSASQPVSRSSQFYASPHRRAQPDRAKPSHRLPQPYVRMYQSTQASACRSQRPASLMASAAFGRSQVGAGPPRTNRLAPSSKWGASHVLGLVPSPTSSHHTSHALA